MSTDPTPPVILPTVRQVILCRDLGFAEDENEWVLARPLSVQFLETGGHFPFREDVLAVYTQLVGGLGAIQLGVEIRQRIDPLDGNDVSFRVVGSSVHTDPYVFPGDVNRLAVHHVTFRFADLPFEYEGSYEFRIVALTAAGEVPLEGNVATVTYLEADGGKADA